LSTERIGMGSIGDKPISFNPPNSLAAVGRGFLVQTVEFKGISRVLRW
jgi:hypothetical protein